MTVPSKPRFCLVFPRTLVSVSPVQGFGPAACHSQTDCLHSLHAPCVCVCVCVCVRAPRSACNWFDSCVGSLQFVRRPLQRLKRCALAVCMCVRVCSRELPTRTTPRLAGLSEITFRNWPPLGAACAIMGKGLVNRLTLHRPNRPTCK